MGRAVGLEERELPAAKIGGRRTPEAPWIDPILSPDIRLAVGSRDIDLMFGNTAHRLQFIEAWGKARVSAIERQLGKPLAKCKAAELNQVIATGWSYERDLKILRRLFKGTRRYGDLNQASADSALLSELMAEHNITWGDADATKKIKSTSRKGGIDVLTFLTKSKEYGWRSGVVNRQKQQRSLLFEFAIFDGIDSVIPAMADRKAGDLYLDGRRFDVKVSDNVGGAFRNLHGENWREVALAHPELVAKSLLENQFQERFGASDRIYVVYLDDVENDEAVQQVQEYDFSQEPHRISFTYRDRKTNETSEHETCAHVIFLQK